MPFLDTLTVATSILLLLVTLAAESYLPPSPMRHLDSDVVRVDCDDASQQRCRP